jgi:hypothetical protein
VLSPQGPYRTPAPRSPPKARKTPRALAALYRIAPWVLFAWALARVAVCTSRPVDFETVFAVVVVVTFIMSPR